MLLIWTLTSAVSHEDRVTVVIIIRYGRYNISLSKLLLAGFVERKLACDGLFESQ